MPIDTEVDFWWLPEGVELAPLGLYSPRMAHFIETLLFVHLTKECYYCAADTRCIRLPDRRLACLDCLQYLDPFWLVEQIRLRDAHGH